MLLFGWFFPLPCLRAPGRGVPGFLAGPALVFCCCFSSMIQILSFVIFTRMSHVSQCTKGSAPIRESCTDFSPLINRWWTNRTRLHGPIGLRAKKNTLKLEGSETICFSIHGHPEPSSDGFRGVSELFWSGPKLCGFRGVPEWSETVWFQRGFRVVSNRVVLEGFQNGLKRCGFRGFQRGFRVVSGVWNRVVSEGFQSGLKPCGFRVVSEWSETAWFQSGFRVVWNRVVSEGFQRSLNDFGQRLLKIYCNVSPMIIGETSQ